MKISVIGPTYPYKGGIAQHTTLTVRALRAAGHDVDFISYRRQYPKLLYGRSDKDPSTDPIQEPVEYLIDSINPLTWFRVARHLIQRRPDLIVLPWWTPFWTPLISFLGVWLSLRLPSGQKIFIAHNVYPHEEGRLKRLLSQWIFRFADGVVLHARSEERKLKGIHPEIPVVWTPMPPFEEIFSVRTPGSTRDTAFKTLLFFGIVRPYKGLDLLIESMPTLVNRYREVRLIVAGEFWDPAERYRTEISRLGLGDRVEIIDRYIPNEELAELFGQTDLVVLPYKSATQSGVLPTVLAAGLPVVTTKVGGLIDLIEDGVNGILVDPYDSDALADGVIRYFETGIKSASRPAGSWDELARLIARFGTNNA